MPAYLDHAATTPMRPEALAALVAVQTEQYGNPSGAHLMAREARRVLEDAREVMAEALGAQPREVVFTAGGTEADNLALFGVARRRPGVAVCTAIEHHAVLHPVESLHGRLVGVDARGVIDLDALAAALDDSVAIVSVMLANNESGVIQPLADVARMVLERAPQAVLHTDAVQAFPWLDVAALARDAQLISVSAHKFGGPKGVGALVVRDGVAIEPLLLGGGQERDLRSGTQNVAGIASMAAAARATVATRAETVTRVGALRDRLTDGLRATVPDVHESGVTRADRHHKIAGSCHVCIGGIESESLLFLLERAGVYASAASSCASGAQDPSHVLAAMGVSRELAQGSLRLSLGWASTEADVDLALDAVPGAVAQLRRLAPTA
ncbi:MAG TPA: cysteine desulfurase family protein [Acidimicrobiales bacterium]|jgi:cysteine desulfurase|nr:cysteine desulfurase family protein [Acidimicrobiales bacterium]